LKIGNTETIDLVPYIPSKDNLEDGLDSIHVILKLKSKAHDEIKIKETELLEMFKKYFEN
jgi:hypothetical protein